MRIVSHCQKQICIQSRALDNSTMCRQQSSGGGGEDLWDLVH
jgi:hypothetical protein